LLPGDCHTGARGLGSGCGWFYRIRKEAIVVSKKGRSLLLAVAALAFMVGAAQTATPEFYRGKTIRIVVGLAAGGGFDTYSRAIARHMGKHIPGHPAIIVENMTGAGSLIAANYVYKRLSEK
jgi:tripartite-type tricarboxylate transporter receptor subunit TctC